MLKQIVSKTADALLLPFSIKALCNLFKVRLIAPCYHTVSDRDLAHVKHLYPYRSSRQFEQDMDFFARHCEFITLKQLIAHVSHGTALPARACLLTFDDGLREIYEVVAPVLKQRGIPAVFFINTAFLDNKAMFFRNKASVLVEMYYQNKFSEQQLTLIKSLFEAAGEMYSDFAHAVLSIKYPAKQNLITQTAACLEVDFSAYLQKQQPYMSFGQVRELIDQGFYVGGHSIDHPYYPDLTLEEQARQTLQSVNSLQKKFALDYKTFAFPYNDQGMKRIFFDRIFPELCLSFGIEGFIDDDIPRNVQRFWVEYTSADMNTICRYYIRQKMLRCLSGKRRIVRL